jgi:hypothetical protein
MFNFKNKLSWVGFLLMGVWLISMVFATGPALTAIAAGKPPTATPTPSGGPTPTPAPATTYYVDCSAATNGNGTQSSPWNSLTSPNATTFSAGSSLLFKRGVTCNGEFVAHGSGSASAPITLADYGTGALPVIDGGTTNTDVILLSDVEYYDLKNLMIRGGSLWGVNITGSAAGLALHHFNVINLDISAVNHVATARNDSGLLNIAPNGTNETISDVLVDGVTTHDTTAGDGITVGGGRIWTCSLPCVTGTNITVRNSTSHDMYGDGIVIWSLENGTIENSVSYQSGKCPIGACSGSTPVGIWTWNTNNVTVQNNESYSHHTWATAGGDGGGFDVDGDNLNNTYQYNYAHDSEGFCAALYDFNSAVSTTNTIFRYNVCANNVQRVVGYSEIRIASWQSGKLENLQIYNNTLYYNPAPATITSDSAVFTGNSASYVGNSFAKNNIAYSTTVSRMATLGNGGLLAFDYNLYYTPGSVGYTFKRLSQVYTSLSAWQSATSQDLHSLSGLDPKLNGLGYHSVGKPTLTNGFYTLQTTSPALNAGTNVCATSCNGNSMGAHDYFGIALDATHNIGAYEGNGQ